MTTTGTCGLAFVLLLGAGTPQAKTVRVPADHPTIQKAIDAAGPGDTVLVDAGTYPERVRLKAGVILKSAGDDRPGKTGLTRAEATVIDGEGRAEGGPGVVLAEGSVLDGFTVTRIGKFDQAEYDAHYATHGENLPLERGAVGASGEADAVSAAGVTAVVRNNLVHDNGHAGIGCTAGPGKRNGSWVVGNIVHRNMGGGIGSADGATPLVERNRCYSNLRGGIGNRKSAAVIVNNECFDNVRAGIGIREGATPVVRGNKCYKNRRAGIGIRMEGTAPVVEDNDCYQNAMAGIGCRDGARPFVRGNRCYENALAGIGAMTGARPVISGNACYRNKDAGIGVEAKAGALITDNECYENEKAGIGQREETETLITGNHVHHNKLSGIGFGESGGGTSVVDRNKVVENGTVAVGIPGGWSVRLTNNLLSRDAGMPPLVMVFKGSHAEFSGNTFRGSGVAALRTEGVTRLINNVFESTAPRKGGGGPPQSAVWALPGSDVLFAENTVQGLRRALSADPGATATEYGNKISD